MTARPRPTWSWIAVGAVALLLLVAPLLFSEFFLSVILTKALWLGVAAASLIFLSGYAGMVSLGQVGLYGIAGFAFANLVAADGGVSAALDPFVAAALALVIVTLVGLGFGALASRSEGIYFLMITLAFSVIVYYFWSQVTSLSGFGGVNNVDLPGFVGNPAQEPNGLYYLSLIVAALVYAGIRYLERTPFGLSLQGIRDDPTRMRALGFNIGLHKTLAFTMGAFVAGLAGILSVFYNSRISPGSINLGQTIDVLVIAVVGGLYRLEGAWIGALVFALIDNYSREWTPEIGTVLGPERFNTLIGIVFLVIVLVSPGGLVGIWESARDRLRGGGRMRMAGLDAEMTYADTPAQSAPPAAATTAEKGGGGR